MCPYTLYVHLPVTYVAIKFTYVSHLYIGRNFDANMCIYCQQVNNPPQVFLQTHCEKCQI